MLSFDFDWIIIRIVSFPCAAIRVQNEVTVLEILLSVCFAFDIILQMHFNVVEWCLSDGEESVMEIFDIELSTKFLLCCLAKFKNCLLSKGV